MPLFTIPSLSSATYHDGTPVLPGDTVMPILAVVNANQKVAFVRGNPIVIQDRVAPAISGFVVEQAAGGYTISPSVGTLLTDLGSGDVNVYHVVALTSLGAMDAAALLTLINDGANAGKFGAETAPTVGPGDVVNLASLSGLATAQVYTGPGGGFRAVAEGDTVTSYLLAVDASNNASVTAAALGLVADHTPPTFSSGPEVTSSNESNFTLSWTLTDGGDVAASAATPLYLGVYSSASAPTAAEVVAEGGDDLLQLITIADGKSTTSQVIGNGAGDVALSPGTAYYVYAVAEDSLGNRQATPTLTAANTADQTTPANLGLVTVAPGQNDPTTEITFSNLALITDNVEVTSVSVLYGTDNDWELATWVVVPWPVTEYTVMGLSPDTQYYCWTTASDAAGNTAGPTPVSGGSATTDTAGSEVTIANLAANITGTNQATYDALSDSITVFGSSNNFLNSTIDTANFSFNGATYTFKFSTTRLDGTYNSHNTELAIRVRTGTTIVVEFKLGAQTSPSVGAPRFLCTVRTPSGTQALSLPTSNAVTTAYTSVQGKYAGFGLSFDFATSQLHYAVVSDTGAAVASGSIAFNSSYGANVTGLAKSFQAYAVVEPPNNTMRFGELAEFSSVLDGAALLVQLGAA